METRSEDENYAMEGELSTIKGKINMKKILTIISSTRADYGLLHPIIVQFRKHESDEFFLRLAVTGTHLSAEYGYTIQEIVDDGIRIDDKIPCPIGSKTSKDIANNIGETIKKFTKSFEETKPTAIMVLGDRYEILGVCIAATICKIPIFHVSGGDVSEGAIDDNIRHSITKLSVLHFPTNEEARCRIIQMGEDPSRVFNTGSTGIDNIIDILENELIPKDKLLRDLGINYAKSFKESEVNESDYYNPIHENGNNVDDYIVCTYHPVTLEDSENKAIEEVKILIKILADTGIHTIITKSNSDLGGAKINQYLDEADSIYDNIHVRASLGRVRYLSAVKNSLFVIGNSSSGVIEAPALKVPVIDIGDRQKGRLCADSVIHVPMEDRNQKSYVKRMD